MKRLVAAGFVVSFALLITTTAAVLWSQNDEIRAITPITSDIVTCEVQMYQPEIAEPGAAWPVRIVCPSLPIPMEAVHLFRPNELCGEQTTGSFVCPFSQFTEEFISADYCDLTTELVEVSIKAHLVCNDGTEYSWEVGQKDMSILGFAPDA